MPSPSGVGSGDDPDPDAAKSYVERERMFKLPRSNWTEVQLLRTSGERSRANIYDILLKGIDGGRVRLKRKDRDLDINPYLTTAEAAA